MSRQQPEQIKDSRPIAINAQAHAEVFGSMQPGTVYSVPAADREKVLPPDYPGRSTVEVAGSGLGFGGYAVEQIIGATKDGQAIHKIYRYVYETLPDGRIVRKDVTYDFSSPEVGQINDHHQTPKETTARIGLFTSCEYL